MVAESQKKTSGTTLGLGTAFKGLWISIKNATAAMLKFLFTTPVGWATLAVGAITTVVLGVKQYRENITKAAEESKDAINEIANSYKNLYSTVSDIKKRYAELAQGVNQFTGENKTLSNDDYAEFLDLSNQLADLFPSLSKRYDENGNAILNLSGDVDAIVDSLTNLVEVEKQLANKKIIEELPSVLKGYNLNRSDLDSELKSLEEWQHYLEVAYESLQDINKVYTTGFLNNNSGYLEAIHVLSELGIEYETIDYEEGFGFGTIALENYDDSLDKISRSLKTVIRDITNLNSEIKSENAEFNKYLSSWLFDNWSYVSLDPELQKVIQEMLFNTDWLLKAKSQGVNTKDWDEVSEWIEKSYISAIANVDDDNIKSALLNLYAIPTGEQSISEYVENFKKAIQDIIVYNSQNDLKIPINMSFLSDNSYVDTYNRLQNSISQLARDHGIFDYEDYDYLSEYTEGFTQEQAELWLTATSGASSATEAVQMYEDKLAESQPLSTILNTSADSLDKFQSTVKSAADAYATLLSDNYSSTELLDSIQAINQAVTDMGESIDWEDIASLDLLGDKLEEVSQKYAESILSGAGINANSDFGQIFTDIISQMYEAEAEFTEVNSQLDNLQSSYQTLTGILESYNETGHISLDNLQSLLTADENLIAMLEVENGQLVINQTAYENLVATQLLEFKAKLDDAAAAEIEALAKEKSEEATNNNAKASEDAVAKLDAETEAFKRNTKAAGENAITKAIADAEEAGVSEEEIQSVLDKYTEIWNAAMDNYNTDFPAFMNGAKSGASSAGEAAGKSAGKAFTDALDKELASLDKNLESGYIDFNDYIQARLALIEDYYNQGKLSADEYYSYLEKHYNTQLSYMDKVVNAVTRRIDAELDALKQQKEDVDNIYKVQIESLEKQKTLLEEVNQERQRQIDLQKSLYDLERAKNQRTQLVYTEDKGMHYIVDEQSIRDAQENVDNAGYDIKIAEIDKSISNLEEARDKETDAIDEMISDLEAYRDAWNDVTSAYEEEQENLFAAQILGAAWETDILNGRLDVLDAFKNQYISIQQAMAAAAWESANEQIKAAEEAEKGASGSPSKTPNISGAKDKSSEDVNPQISRTSSGGGGGNLHSLGLGSNKLSYVNLQAYASGTNNAKRGLNLVAEDGPEAYFDNHGHVAIVTKPTLIPMEGGEVVKNERDTKKLLDPDNLASVDTIGLADFDEKGAEYTIKVLPDSRALTPVSQEEYIRELLQKAPIFSKQVQTEQISPEIDLLQRPEKSAVAMRRSFENMMNPMNIITHNMQELTSMGKYMNHINNVRNAQPVINGGINITCPGVTSKEVAKQLPGVLNEALEREFSGLHLQAMQWT